MNRILENWIRKHFSLYIFIRNRLLLITRIHPLENEFQILKLIAPLGISSAVDVGSNDGTSILSIRKYGRKPLIFAFDPVKTPDVKLNDNEFYNNIGLGSQESMLDLFIPIYKKHKLTQYSSSSEQNVKNQLAIDADINLDELTIEKRSVNISTLDHFNFRPFFIKIDVEGFEFEVLLGAQKTIADFRPILLLEIQSSDAFDEINALITTLNYQAYYLEGGINSISRTKTWKKDRRNYIFIPISASPTWKWKSISDGLKFEKTFGD